MSEPVHADDPINHHSTSQFLLRPFGDTEHRIWCYGKNRPPVRRAIRHVAAEPDYHTLILPDRLDRQTAEEAFGRLETVAAPLIKKLAASHLPDRRGREEVAEYLHILRLNSPAGRLSLEDEARDRIARHREMLRTYVEDPLEDWLDDDLRDLLAERTTTVAKQAAARALLADMESSEGGAALLNNIPIHATHLSGPSHLAAKTLADMRWTLLRAPDSYAEKDKPSEFVTSDNPVVLCNDEHGVLGNVFAQGPAVELTLPLNPKVALLVSSHGPDGPYPHQRAVIVRRVNARTVRAAFGSVFGARLWPGFQEFVQRNIGAAALSFPELL